MIADGCLAHEIKTSAVASIYNFSQPYEKQRQVWELWAEHLTRVLDGTVDGDTGNVLKLFG